MTDPLSDEVGDYLATMFAELGPLEESVADRIVRDNDTKTIQLAGWHRLIHMVPYHQPDRPEAMCGFRITPRVFSADHAAGDMPCIGCIRSIAHHPGEPFQAIRLDL